MLTITFFVSFGGRSRPASSRDSCRLTGGRADDAVHICYVDPGDGADCPLLSCEIVVVAPDTSSDGVEASFEPTTLYVKSRKF